MTITHGSLEVDSAEIARLATHVLDSESVAAGYLGIILCSRGDHMALHHKYLGSTTPTDVLAFDLEPQSDELDGEVYVDLDTALERHAEFGATFDEEVARYVVHGILHLVGYRDKNQQDAKIMQERQEFLLNGFLDRPTDAT